MKISFNYAIEFGSEVPPEVQADAMEEAWAMMEIEAKRNRERVDLYSNYILEEPLMTVEGFDYAIMGISEHPRAVVVYDYWKCLEVLIVGDGMGEDEAVESLDTLIADYTDNNEPLFIQPFEFFDNSEEDEEELVDDVELYSEEDEDGDVDEIEDAA